MSFNQPHLKHEYVFDEKFISIEDIISIAKGDFFTTLSENPDYLDFIQHGADFVMEIVDSKRPVYGINTGLGDSCDVSIDDELVFKLPHKLYTYHGCGLGQPFSVFQSRAIMAVRLASLCKGYSGVRPLLLHQILTFLNVGITPIIPSEGSVGASGDLTPLSYLAATLCGERNVLYQGKQKGALKVMSELGLTPIELMPKESLAIMNGTTVMTALACEAYTRANYLMELTTRITSMASFSIAGNINHFDPLLFKLKPHNGIAKIANWISNDLFTSSESDTGRIQDRYSIRCAPHIVGVLADALPWIKKNIEDEINSVNDNPVIDWQSQRVMHGGHFYGGHIGFAMDSLKNLIANLADMMDRQMALLVDTRYSNGLPSNLSGSIGKSSVVNHGLKGLQISVSAWTAEALKLTMPASVFSRSTECHNQDKVSMGTISSRDCLRVLELTEQVAAALLISVFQGVKLRLKISGNSNLNPRLESMMSQLSKEITFIKDDRELQPLLENLLLSIRSMKWLLFSDLNIQ